MADLRATVVRQLDAVGVGDKARQARALFQPRWARRNAVDDARLELLLRLSLPVDAVCVDVGANVGTILAAMVAAAPDGRHLAFEPVPALAADLRAQFPQVEVSEAAVSDRTGEATFTVVGFAPSRSGLQATLPADGREERGEAITVPTVRLDDVLAGARPAVIKIDVEGGELGVLRGARAVLSEHQPMVAFEFGHGGRPYYLDQCRDVFGELARAGLRVFDLDGMHLPWDEFLNVYQAGSRWNFVAHR